MVKFIIPKSRDGKQDRIINEVYLNKRENVVQFVWSIKLEWTGHVWWADGRLMKRIISEEMEGTRSRKRSRQKWMNSIRETMMKYTQSREIDWNISKNREKLKDLVSVAKSLNGL